MRAGRGSASIAACGYHSVTQSSEERTRRLARRILCGIVKKQCCANLLPCDIESHSRETREGNMQRKTSVERHAEHGWQHDSQNTTVGNNEDMTTVRLVSKRRPSA